jgi:GTP1/Obg family GTP-binding protein
MGIGIIFQLASEVFEVRVDKGNVMFRTSSTNGAFGTIDNLQLNFAGVIKEHPDLKDSKEWRKEAIIRFKDKIKQMNEIQAARYIIQDLTRFGYKPLYSQKDGFRVTKISNDKQFIQ